MVGSDARRSSWRSWKAAASEGSWTRGLLLNSERSSGASLAVVAEAEVVVVQAEREERTGQRVETREQETEEPLP